MDKRKGYKETLVSSFLNRYLCSETSPSFITSLIHLPSYEPYLDFIQSMGKRHVPSVVKAHRHRFRRSRGLWYAPEASLDTAKLH